MYGDAVVTPYTVRRSRGVLFAFAPTSAFITFITCITFARNLIFPGGNTRPCPPVLQRQHDRSRFLPFQGALLQSHYQRLLFVLTGLHLVQVSVCQHARQCVFDIVGRKRKWCVHFRRLRSQALHVGDLVVVVVGSVLECRAKRVRNMTKVHCIAVLRPQLTDADFVVVIDEQVPDVLFPDITRFYQVLFLLIFPLLVLLQLRRVHSSLGVFPERVGVKPHVDLIVFQNQTRLFVLALLVSALNLTVLVSTL